MTGTCCDVTTVADMNKLPLELRVSFEMDSRQC